MNRLENWFCSSWIWRRATAKYLLPRLLRNCELGDQVLELGAGPGAGTEFLRHRARHVISLEYDAAFVRKLQAEFSGTNVKIVQGDAAALPFPSGTFSAVVSTFVLHHLPSTTQQDAAIGEIARVLVPCGVFLALEIPDSRLMRLSHFRDTYVPVSPERLAERLRLAGFSDVAVDVSRAFYRVRAVRGACDGRVDRCAPAA